MGIPLRRRRDDTPAMSLSIVEKEVNQLRLTLQPYRTTVSGVGYNRIMTSFYMVPTRVAIQTSVPLAQSAGPHHSISTGILIAIIVPAAVVAFIIIPFLYLLYRRRVRRRLREGVYDEPASKRFSDDSPPQPFEPVITAWSAASPPAVSATQFPRDEKLFLALGNGLQPRNPDIVSPVGVAAASTSAPRRSSTQRSRSTRSGSKASYTAPQALPDYHHANGRHSLSTDSHYTGTIVTRRPSQRRPELAYPTVPIFLDYIGTLPGAERRNIAQYAPTFLAQDYYTLDELRDLTQAQLCEAIPGLTRGNADYICQMVAQELERIEAASYYTYGTAF